MTPDDLVFVITGLTTSAVLFVWGLRQVISEARKGQKGSAS